MQKFLISFGLTLPLNRLLTFLNDELEWIEFANGAVWKSVQFVNLERKKKGFVCTNENSNITRIWMNSKNAIVGKKYTLYGVGFKLRLWSLRSVLRQVVTLCLTSSKPGNGCAMRPSFHHTFKKNSNRYRWQKHIFFYVNLNDNYPVQGFYFCRNDVTSFRFLKRMSAQYFFTYSRRFLAEFLHQIDQRVSWKKKETI